EVNVFGQWFLTFIHGLCVNMDPHEFSHVYLVISSMLVMNRDETVYMKWEDRMERAATTASSLEAKQDSGSGPRCQDTILGGANAQTSFEIASKRSYDPPLSRGYTLGSREDKMEITATIDGRVKTITEASIRRHLKLEDSYGISTLPNIEIFEQLALMGNMRRASNGYPRVDTPLFQTMLVQDQALHVSIQTTPVVKEAAPMPHDLPLPRVYSLGSDEGSMTLKELMVYGKAYTKLVMRVKKLEKNIKTSQARRKARVVVSDDDVKLEDSSKQGRKIAEIDQDPSISLVQDEGTSWFQEDAEIQGRTSADTEIFLDQAAEPTELVEDLRSGEKGEKEISTAGAEVSTASPDVCTAVEILVYIRRSAARRKDKGKAVMQESEPPKKIKKRVQSDPAVLRHHAVQNRSFSKDEVRKNMLWDQNHAFIPKDSEIEKEVMKRPGFDLQQESTQKEEKIKSKQVEEEIKLAVKSPIVSWKSYCKGDVGYYEIHKTDGSYKTYIFFNEMLNDFDREDLIVLYRLFNEKYASTRPCFDDLMLWGDLKIMFDPDSDDEVWKNHLHQELIEWKLYDSCGVHSLMLEEVTIHMLVEKNLNFISKDNVFGSILSKKRLEDLIQKKLDDLEVSVDTPNWELIFYAYSCDELALIRRIFFAGYGVCKVLHESLEYVRAIRTSTILQYRQTIKHTTAQFTIRHIPNSRILQKSSLDSMYVTLWTSPHLPLHRRKNDGRSFWQFVAAINQEQHVKELGNWIRKEYEINEKWWDSNCADIAAAGLGKYVRRTYLIWKGLSRAPIQIRETTNGGISIFHVTEAEVTSQEEMLSFLLCGSVCTTTGSTNMNSQSRRIRAAVMANATSQLQANSWRIVSGQLELKAYAEVHASKFQELGALRT
ncbi:ribonuclease H-like domain-containing protein, partial [Tanacetum coccineum]